MGASDSEELIGQTLGNKFVVRRCLGAGGMGAVYEAEHSLTKRIGALKLLHPSGAESSQIVERFVREASAAGRIGNPHIVETYDAGELPSGEPYMFMELLDGLPVSELLKRRGRLSVEEAREIAMQAAEGLAAAHAAGIVHRDVKPENLFLCRGEPAYVKLLDFGISKFGHVQDHRLTAEGVPMGTPYYMSPEQVVGKADIGPASDVYSLGVVLYECVTGRVPFDAGTLPALSIKIFEGSYAPPSSVIGSLGHDLDSVIARAMATAPTQRYQNMAEFRTALSRLGSPAPASLKRTLESSAAGASALSLPRAPNHSAALERTADLASEPGARPGASSAALHATAAAARLPAASEWRVLSGEQRRRRRLSAAWLLAALAGLGGLGVALSRASMPGAPPAADSADLATPRANSAPVTVTPSSVVESAAPSAPPPLRSSSPAPRAAISNRAGVAAPSAPPPTKAARDGLSEQNPFVE